MTTEFPDSSVTVNGDLTTGLVSHLQGWCEELVIYADVRNSHIDVISRLSNLKSLEIGSGALDDEGLLGISRLRALRKLKIGSNKRRTSVAGWLVLARLSRLEFLEIPLLYLNGRYDYFETKQLVQELQQRLPETIVRGIACP
jgi:hypothetical protein